MQRKPLLIEGPFPPQIEHRIVNGKLEHIQRLPDATTQPDIPERPATTCGRSLALWRWLYPHLRMITFLLFILILSMIFVYLLIWLILTSQGIPL